MKSLVEQVKDIFNETTKCKNCKFHDDCSKFCYRIEELFGTKLYTEDESNCIFSDNFKIISKDEGGI